MTASSFEPIEPRSAQRTRDVKTMVARSSPTSSALLSCAVLLVLTAGSRLAAELPLPDAVFYGTIRLNCSDVESGDLRAVVERGGVPVTEPVADFGLFEGTPVYALRVPMETNIGAPGDVPNAAQPGDALVALVLDGTPVWTGEEVLAWGSLTELSLDVGSCGVTFLRGDANGTGTVSFADGIFILRWVFRGGATPLCLDAADANDNGAVNFADGIYLLRWVFRGGPMPPPPFGASIESGCGFDPTLDDLACESSACSDAGEGDGGIADAGDAGGGADGRAVTRTDRYVTVVNLRGDAPAEPPLPGDFLRHGQRRDARGLTASGRLLELTPDALRLGAIPVSGIERSVVIANRSEHGQALALRSLSPLFDVRPSSFEIPPAGTFTVWVRADANGTLEDGDPGDPFIEVTAGGDLVARVPVEYEIEASDVAIEAGSVTVRDGTDETIAVPVVVRSAVDIRAVRFSLEYDDAVFAGAVFVSPLAKDKPRSASSGRMLDVGLPGSFAAGTEGVIGHALLTPRTWLDPGVHPVLVRAPRADLADAEADARTILAAATHGEVCCRTPWLDLDGDGRVTAGYEGVLARRHALGEAELYPAHWRMSPSDPPALTVAELLRKRAPYLDVDASGDVDDADFDAITLGLCDRTRPGEDTLARVRNLHLPETLATVQLGTARFPVALRWQTLTVGERVRVPVLLDLDRPLHELDLIVASDPDRVEIHGFEAGARLLSEVEQRREQPGALRIVAPARKQSLVTTGCGAIGYVTVEVVNTGDANSVPLALETSTTSLAGSKIEVGVAEADAPGLELDICAGQARSGAEGWELALYLNPVAPDANLLRFELEYPEVIRALAARGVSRDSKRAIEVHVEDAAERGAASVLVYQPRGVPLRVAAGGEAVARIALAPDGVGVSSSRLEFAGRVTHAALGAESSSIASGHLRVDRRELESCGPAGEDCEVALKSPDLGQALELLGFLFEGRTEPACLRAHDLDGDGAVAARDALEMIRRLVLR